MEGQVHSSLNLDSKNNSQKVDPKLDRNTTRCAMCRKPVNRANMNYRAVTIKLAKRKDTTQLQLIFDKKECVLLFERLRRIYGDDFFYEVAH